MVTLEYKDFKVGGHGSIIPASLLPPTSTNISFSSHLELLMYLANDNAHEPEIQSQIQRLLSENTQIKTWHKERTKLKYLNHFSEYRKTEKYDLYHAAAHAVFESKHSTKQLNMFEGLQKEITSSNLLTPKGQVLFHGRGDEELHLSKSYISFISTSLDPVVAIWHAVKRKNQNNTKAKVYLLTLSEELPAIWGNGGGLKEWELLLEPKLKIEKNLIHSGNRFDIVEATIGR